MTATWTDTIRHWMSATVNWLMPTVSPQPLALFRIGIAGVLILQALAIGPNLHDLYGQNGLVPWSAVERNFLTGVPRLSWLAAALAPLGVSASATLTLGFATYALALACLLIGWATRPAAATAWLIHLAMNVSGYASIYGADEFANIALFYCVCMPVGAVWSVGKQDPVRAEPAPEYGLALRVLQIHLCIVYATSGIAKAQGADWWTGEAIWCAVMQPDAWCDFSWLSAVPWLASVAGWGTLLVEVGYVVFIWPRATRRLWLIAILSMHAGIAVFLGLVSFAALMMVFNVAVFGLPAFPFPSVGGLRTVQRD